MSDLAKGKNITIDNSGIKKEKKSYLLLKRCTDILGSLGGLLFLSILFLIIAICIKLEDPKGKVFFKQLRVGKDGREFYMYKFRSMVSNAEEKLNELLVMNEVDGAMFKMKNDPRVTNIGRFIRRTSIDELPQLYNVLRGEMSLVGPRPPLPREVAEYTNFDKQRLLVVPGCTGLWQISGRNELSFNQMVDLDLQYIKNRTLLFDIQIIIKTVICMIKKDGAY